LLESANPYKSMQSDAQKLVTKWNRSGLLEGLEGQEKNKHGCFVGKPSKTISS